MHSDPAGPDAGEGQDAGLLTPVSAGPDVLVGDRAILDALVQTELGLVRALAGMGHVPGAALAVIERALASAPLDVRDIAVRARGGGNPVIPLLADLRSAIAGVDPSAAVWLHRGVTSQDTLDTALALVGRRAAERILTDLGRIAAALARDAERYRRTPAVARTLGQHSVPTTFGLRVAGWLSGVLVARRGLRQAAEALPVQLGGASGTLASFVELYGEHDAAALPGRLAGELALAAPRIPWHTARAPFTALADALVTVTDALGVIAADVVLLSRTEIGEVAEPASPGRGVSSAMPQKHNPVLSVLMRSAAMRAPSLAADLHRAAAGAVDERPDGAWHSEWPSLRELLRAGLGAADCAAELTAGLRADPSRMGRNLRSTGPMVVSERVMLRLTPVLGKDRVQSLIDRAAEGEDLGALLAAETALAQNGSGAQNEPGAAVPAGPVPAAGDLLDPAAYTGLSATLVDRVLEDYRAEEGRLG